MERHFQQITLSILIALSPIATNADNLYSFETEVPNGWSASKENLNISPDRAKAGNSSLCWKWNAGSVLTATDSDITATSSAAGGGINLWIYNGTPVNDLLTITFQGGSSTDSKCSLPVKLNFKGWRCIWADYMNDMGLSAANKGDITTMKIKAPATGSGTIYFDLFEFTSNVSWEKMSDFQYTVRENVGIDSYLEVRNIKAPTPTSPTDTQKAAFTEIARRLDNWYLGNSKYANDPYYKLRDNAVNSYIRKGADREYTINTNGTIRINTGTTIKQSGLLPHDHYHNQQIDGITAVSSRDIGEGYMIQLAYDYLKNNNTVGKDKAIELLNWYYDQGWADGSSLGTLRFEMLRSAGFFHSAFMLRRELGADLSAKISDAGHWFTRFGTTYTQPENPGELADYIRALAVPKLLYALTLKDEGERTTALTAFSAYMNNALAHAQGYLGSLKPDGSGYHHHAPYYSAYYPQVLYVGCFLHYILHDTPFALSNDAYLNLKQALLSFRFLSAEYNIPGATGGRFPHQTEILQQLIPAFAYLALSKDDAEVTAAFKRLWNPEKQTVKNYIGNAKTDICFSTTYGEVAAVLDAATLSGTAEANPAGTKYMPYSGLLIARQPEWAFTIKGFSSYIWDYESSVTENLYGRYLSYGNIEYTDLTNGYRSCKLTVDQTRNNNTWDWRHIPGTTSVYVSEQELNFNTQSKHRNFSDETFLGGIGLDDTHALFTNKLHDRNISETFRADKSMFVFGNAVYCMGSNIIGTEQAQYTCTTLFQNSIKDNSNPITVEGKRITDNFGNVYLIGGTAEVQTKQNEAYYTAYINHGTDPSEPQSYNYTWLIKPTSEQTAQYKDSSPIEVLKQDRTAHAVYHTTDKILAASIFECDGLTDIRNLHRVNRPLLIMTKEGNNGTYEVAFSNPDMDRPSGEGNNSIDNEIEKVPGAESEIVIELTGTFVKANTDTGGVSVSSTNGITTLTYPAARDGETYRVRLIDPAVSNETEQTDKSGFRVYIVDGQCHMRSNVKEYTWRLTDTGGKTILAGREHSRQAVADVKHLPAGIYLFEARINDKPQLFKLTKQDRL